MSPPRDARIESCCSAPLSVSAKNVMITQANTPSPNPRIAPICRTVCRRAERAATYLATIESVDETVVKYINRLSDAFFVWSRWVALVFKQNEVLWDPNVI